MPLIGLQFYGDLAYRRPLLPKKMGVIFNSQLCEHGVLNAWALTGNLHRGLAFVAPEYSRFVRRKASGQQ